MKIAIALAVAGMTLGAPAVAGDQHREWNACKYEDGSGQRRCLWDARHMGNGSGRSFKIFNGGKDNARIVYISHRRAHHLMTQH